MGPRAKVKDKYFQLMGIPKNSPILYICKANGCPTKKPQKGKHQKEGKHRLDVDWPNRYKNKWPRENSKLASGEVEKLLD